MAYEVDRKWQAHGLTCAVVAIDMGHRCGYVGVPKSHPLYGKGYGDIMPDVKKSDLGEEPIGDRGIMSVFCAAGDGEDVRLDLYFDVHGSLTYSGDGDKGYPIKAPVWWFGFDCGHAGDNKDPGILKRFHKNNLYSWDDPNGVIWGEEYVVHQCEKLAEQLAKFGEIADRGER